MKKILLSILAVSILISCEGQEVEPETQTSVTEPEKTVVAVTSSIIPLSSVINMVGGEYVNVANIIPAGVSPHGFDMSAQQMVALEDSQIVFMTGLEHIDGFLEKAAAEEKQVHLADGMELLEASAHEHDEHDEHEDEEDHDDHSDEEHEDEHHEEDEHSEDHDDEHEDEENHDDHEEHDEHSVDPHVWLGEQNIITITNTVRDELSAILPEQAAYFAQNAEEFTTELKAVYAEFAASIDGKTPQEFIVFHDAYNYLLQSIELDSNLKIPFSENVLHESGTAHFAELIDEIELHGIQYIFSEPQFSNTSLQKFAEQYNLTLGTLDPIGADDSVDGYISNLKSNLSALQKIYE